MNALNGAVAIPDPRSTTYGSLPAFLRGGPLPAGKPSVIGGRPGPRAPVLRAVPGLASLPFVLATLAFSPASGRGAFCACARAWSSPQGGAGCPARAWRSGASCARLGLASPPQPVPCALAPSGPAAWGVGLWAVLLVLLRGSCRAFRRSCGGGLVALFVRCWPLWGCAVSLLSVPVASSVVRSARFALAPWAGCALGVSFRPSARAVSGFVAVVRFSSAVAAGRFAASWGRRLPPVCRGCVVRPVPGGFAVSVPVAPACPVGRGRASRSLALRFAASCPVGA